MKTKRLACLLSLAISATALPLYADNAPASTLELQNIDKQLLDLKSELKELRRQAFNKEMDAQPLMFDNWHEYTEDIGSNESSEKKILAIKAKIEALNKRKDTLLNPNK